MAIYICYVAPKWEMVGRLMVIGGGSGSISSIIRKDGNGIKIYIIFANNNFIPES